MADVEGDNFVVPVNLLDRVIVLEPADNEFTDKLNKMLKMKEEQDKAHLKGSEKNAVYVHKGDVEYGLNMDVKLWIRVRQNLTFMCQKMNEDDTKYRICSQFISWDLVDKEHMVKLEANVGKGEKTFDLINCEEVKKIKKEFDASLQKYPFYIGQGEVAQFLSEKEKPENVDRLI